MIRSIQSLALRLALPVLACVLSASCKSLVDSLAYDDRPVPNEVDLASVQREAVVPALLAQIDENGLFRFPTPNVRAEEMPLDTAQVQAAEYLFFGLNIFVLRNGAESQRGAFIDLPTLVQCSRPLLARSVFEQPPDSLTPALKIQLGSFWHIPFCGTRRTPEVVVSVATLGNSARYKNNRSVGDTLFQHLAFRVFGVPWEWKVEHMVTAEEAVNEAFGVTGARATAIPELVTASQVNGRAAGFVWCPIWRVKLERPVRGSTLYSHRALDLSEVYVGDSDCPGPIGKTILVTPWGEQPASRDFTVFLPDSTTSNGLRRVVHTAQYRAPVTFESVIVVR